MSVCGVILCPSASTLLRAFRLTAHLLWCRAEMCWCTLRTTCVEAVLSGSCSCPLLRAVSGAGYGGVEAQRRHHARRGAADLGLGRQRRLPGVCSVKILYFD